MDGISNQTLHDFMSLCTVKYDVDDYYNDIVTLNDENGYSLAKIDYRKNTEHCDTSIFLDESTEVLLTEPQKNHILDYMDNDIKRDYNRKQREIAENYDVATEQDLYT